MFIVRELKRRNVFRVALAYVIVAWLLLQVSDTLVPALHLPEWFHSGVAFLLILGFPLALLFAWAYELTPEGLKKEKDIDRDQSITHITGRKFDYWIIAVLGLALGYFALDKFVLDPSSEAEPAQASIDSVTGQATEAGNVETIDRSIAVLPFVNMSSDPEQEYFSDGISEELLNVLAKLPGLRVAARTSSFQFKGENRDIVDIGRQLNTALVLEGSVRKAGSQVRIVAQLIDARNGFHLWTDSYDRELDNIFAVQDEIATAIVEALTEHLGLQAGVPLRVNAAANTEAHDAFLRGRHLVVQRTLPAIEEAIRQFENAVALDPEYALAHAELAIAIWLLGTYSSDVTVAEIVEKMAPHAERAMALDPGLAEANAAIACLLWLQDNLDQTVEQFRRAIEINPNYGMAYLWLGNAFSNRLGRYADALPLQEKAAQLDPLSRAAVGTYASNLIIRNRLAEAEREMEKLASIYPNKYTSLRGRILSLGGNWANAVLADLDALQINSNQGWESLSCHLAVIGLEKEALAIPLPSDSFVLSILGKHADAVEAAEARAASDPANNYAGSALGRALASAGDYRRARPLLEKAWQNNGRRVAGFCGASCAAALVAVRRAAGDEASVSELVAAIRDHTRRARESGITMWAYWFYSIDFEEGLSDFLAGEKEKGLSLIAKAAREGAFIPQDVAYLQVLYSDPGFAPIHESQKARQAREREKFLDVVCTENPYAAIWQPTEGTCEQFVGSRQN